MQIGELAMARLPYSERGRELLPKYAVLNVKKSGFGTFLLPERYGSVAIVLERGSEQISPQAETLIMFAARVQHVDGFIRPALARGEWVVCDRFTDSTEAYQGGGRELGSAAVLDLRLIDDSAAYDQRHSERFVHGAHSDSSARNSSARSCASGAPAHTIRSSPPSCSL